MADHDFIFRASLIKTFAIAFGRRLSTDLLASLPGPLEVGFRIFLEASLRLPMRAPVTSATAHGQAVLPPAAH